MNKSTFTNFTCLALIIIGCFPYIGSSFILAAGIFGLSGALTNWLAVHMLFERVPFLYGSGVIPNRFNEFKRVIHEMMMNQFFTMEQIHAYMKSAAPSTSDMESIVQTVDYDLLFERFITVVMESSFGGMLSMFGGEKRLETLRDPFIQKMQIAVRDILISESFQEAISSSIGGNDHQAQMIDSIDQIVRNRLDELTPQMVKEIVHDMIHQHLGWLVVWGGVLGGIIGLFSELIRNLVVNSL